MSLAMTSHTALDFNFAFLQGVDDNYDGLYIKPIRDSLNGLFVFDTSSGAWQRLYSGRSISTVSFEDADSLIGIASDAQGTYLFRAAVDGSRFDILARTPQLDGDAIWRQGDYRFDPATDRLYISGSRNDQNGMHVFDMSGTPTYSFSARSTPYHIQLVDGRIVTVDIPGAYSVPQGIDAFDPKTGRLYMTCMYDPLYGQPGNEGESVEFGLVSFVFNGSQFVFEKFVEIGFQNMISNLSYDPVQNLLFAEKNLGSSIALVALDFDGNIYTLGNSVGNQFTGTSIDDYYLGLGGNDTIAGGGGEDFLEGGIGNDTVYGGTGDDVIVAGNGAGDDLYYGGDGADLVIYTSAFAGIEVNLDTNRARSILPGDPAGIGSDRVFGVSNVKSGNFSDVLLGNELSNVLQGMGGRDSLSGFAGADRLIGGTGNDVLRGHQGEDGFYGGSGNDVIYGGEGRDTLYGELGADTLSGGTWSDHFVFNRVIESNATLTRDVILDFQSGADKIILGVIDANSRISGNQAFTFIGASNFSGVAGQLRYFDGKVYGDVNGDRTFDFSIELIAKPILTAADFAL